MKTIFIRGPVTTESGYGNHARQIARWLFEKHSNNKIIVGATPWGNTPWKLNHDKDELLKKLYSSCVNLTQQPDITFQIQLPNEWEPLGKFNVGITAAIETDICNPEWITACNKMSVIVVPSEHAKRSLTNTGNITVPIHIIPEAYFDAIDLENTLDPEQVFSFDTSFNFLIVGQLTATNANDDRKNIFNTVKWICEEFKNDNDVGIIIKTNTARNTKIDRENVVSLLKKLSFEIKREINPKIHLIHGSLSEQELKCLYTHPTVKSLVTLTRGEGFGLPILEAAASGLPIIATNWSAHTEFLKYGKFINVNYDIVNVPRSKIDGKIFVPNCHWADANEYDFKKKLRKFYSASSAPRQWANDLASIIRQKYNSAVITDIYESTFGNLI